MKPPQTTVGTSYPVLPRHGACLACRKRKMKCDATKPECYECVAMHRKCQYEDETYRSRTQQLQDRIKELEAKIKAAEEQGSSGAPTSHTSSRAAGSLADRSTPSEASNGSHLGSSSTGISRTWPPMHLLKNSSFTGSLSSFPNTPSPVFLANLSRWSEPPAGKDPSLEETRKLLQIFIIRQVQCGFELHMDRVIEKLKPEASEPVIPALLNAMLLLACHFAENSLKGYENMFLDLTKKEIDNNLDRALGGKSKYNAIYHLQAMCLLSQYYYIKGRLLEAHFHCAAAVRVAVALGTHQINSYIFKPTNMAKRVKRVFRSDRWYPRDPIELGEAINVWWMACTMDYGGSVLTGLSPAVHREEVTTVWPRMLSDYENDYPLPIVGYSVAALLDPLLYYDVADSSRDNVKALISKATTLMERAGQLDIERVANPAGSEDWWRRFEDCDRAVMRIMETMPPVQLARNVEELAYLVIIHTATYCANVQLHSSLAELEITMGAQGNPFYILPDGSLGGLSYLRCTEACRAAALAASLVADVDLSYMHMFIGLAWVCVSEVLIRDVPRLRKSGHMEQAKVKESQLGIMERSMARLVATYPVLELQVKQLQQLKKW